MKCDAPREVVSIRLTALERLALLQLADIMGVSRSGALRDCLVAAMRHAMLSHPEWPLHAAWAGVGDGHWTMELFQSWAWAVSDEDPAAHFEKIRLDGVRGYRLKPGPPAPNFIEFKEWPKHIESYWDRMAAKAEAALAAK